ncbi:ankyrin repeat domain-containing protein [Microbacterium sp. RG1]|uniref:ankyrin repeat domain-containing protein n=1 Tax=Microbacterium sp. RG1 TaxID=2489212 RepID=UPI0010CA6200|nr:ankyrin repeat domain-containing protein [Microbacterium sp. RG1]QCQ17193.1 ankyrin repeat domain-containing protein [Microbacterium sp. RG1]
MDVFLTARMKPATEFFKAFDPSDVARLAQDGRSLVMMALGNTDLASRYEVSNFLLDHGAPLGGPGSGGVTVLHVLFGHAKHDIAEDVKLAQRLIEHGADVNALDDARRLPFLEVLNMKYTDDDLAPIYDLWFQQPVLDFTTESVHGLSPIKSAAKLPYRKSILERMESYVSSHP